MGRFWRHGVISDNARYRNKQRALVWYICGDASCYHDGRNDCERSSRTRPDCDWRTLLHTRSCQLDHQKTPPPCKHKTVLISNDLFLINFFSLTVSVHLLLPDHNFAIVCQHVSISLIWLWTVSTRNWKYLFVQGTNVQWLVLAGAVYKSSYILTVHLRLCTITKWPLLPVLEKKCTSTSSRFSWRIQNKNETCAWSML